MEDGTSRRIENKRPTGISYMIYFKPHILRVQNLALLSNVTFFVVLIITDKSEFLHFSLSGVY